MAEGISTLFTLLSLHFSRNTLSYPAAATLTLYLRETSSLTPTQLEQLASYESNKPNYTAIRESLGFSSLEPRNISASASLYVFGLLALIRFMLNKWLYADAPVITMPCFHFVVSFGFLHLIIVLATSRALTREEIDTVEEQFQTYLLTHHLEQSLNPDPKARKPRRTDIDDSWLRLLLFIVSYLFLSVVAVIILQLILADPPKRSVLTRYALFSRIPWAEILNYISIFPRILVVCFALMKLGNWKPWVGKWAG
jgi:hypothetical protein